MGGWKYFFFFKQKTAYEMRISDWSSDVCSSDLVVVGLPDVKGREQILQVHMRKVPLSDNVEPMIVARGTPGFSGADLANLVNEAALFAARENAKDVRMDHFDKARDKIMMGAERRSMAMSENGSASFRERVGRYV